MAKAARARNEQPSRSLAIVHTAGGMSAKVVLLSVANYADEYGECWAAQATLAAGAECSVRQLSAAC